MSFVTTVSASGVAEGRFDSVSFNVSVRGRGDTGPKAKAATQEVTSRLYTAVQLLKEHGTK